MSKTILFQTIQFSISTQFSSILTIDRTLSGVTTAGQSVPGSDGNKGVLRISQSSSITIRLFNVISWTLVERVLQLCRDAVSVFCSPSRLGKIERKKERKKGRKEGRDRLRYLFTQCLIFIKGFLCYILFSISTSVFCGCFFFFLIFARVYIGSGFSTDLSMATKSGVVSPFLRQRDREKCQWN